MIFDNEYHKQIAKYIRGFDIGWTKAIEISRGSIKAALDLANDENIIKMNKENTVKILRDAIISEYKQSIILRKEIDELFC